MSEILTDRDALAAAPANGDFIHIVDISDTTDNAAGSSKKITVQNFLSGLSATYQPLDAELTAIAGLTSAANKIPMFSGSGTASVIDFKDEDTQSSDSATAVPSQQSVKAYVDSGTVTMTNKTLTTPTITKPVMNATNPTAQTYAPSAAGTATLDLSLSNQHYITMPAGNITVALSNDTNNQVFIVSILQDGTGSRTVTWFSTIRWAGGSAPTLTTTASKRDVLGFIRTGSGTYDGFVIGKNI